MTEGSDEFMGFAGRLLDQYGKLFVFTRYPEIECTNNIAEKALRTYSDLEENFVWNSKVLMEVGSLKEA